MKFVPIPLAGAYLIELEPSFDERGFFARSWSAKEFEARGLDSALAQCSISFNTRKGTLRGLHYQDEPYAEAKLVRCSAGAIYDVLVDLRRESSTHRKWFGVELTAENRKMLYVPKGFAHGFQTLADNTEIFYQISEDYRSEASRGARWNDPAFAIDWPLANPILSERDRTFPDYTP
jgi:dTDP-4-dehydrorhamnose 3,5-epimerase